MFPCKLLNLINFRNSSLTELFGNLPENGNYKTLKREHLLIDINKIENRRITSLIVSKEIMTKEN